jgi:small subunit ribosomal protein S4
MAEREPGVTGLNLLRHLELRLDNIVYRLGMGSSRNQARQLVAHRHFEVNGRTVNVPSYRVKPGDVIRARAHGEGVIAIALDSSQVRPVPSWLSFNLDERSGKVLALPGRDEMETGVEEQLIVEFYSR